jgi:hypothetical protein
LPGRRRWLAVIVVFLWVRGRNLRCSGLSPRHLPRWCLCYMVCGCACRRKGSGRRGTSRLHLRWFRAAAMAARMSLARLVLDVACGDAWRRLACVIQLARDMAGGCAIRETQPTSNLLVEASRLGFSRNISGLSILAINSASELRPQCYIRACLLTGVLTLGLAWEAAVPWCLVSGLGLQHYRLGRMADLAVCKVLSGLHAFEQSTALASLECPILENFTGALLVNLRWACVYEGRVPRPV